MIDKNVVKELVDEWLQDKEYFLVSIEMSLQLSNGSLNNWVADDGICCSLRNTTCDVSIAEVVWKVTDTWNLVY